MPHNSRENEPGEAAQRRRQLLLMICTVLLLTMQLIAIQAAHRIHTGPARAVDIVQLFAPILIAGGLMRGLFGAPMRVSAQAKRAALDELSTENRNRALAFGFVVTVALSALLAILLPFADATSFEIGHLVFGTLVSATIFRFVWLERRGGEEPE